MKSFSHAIVVGGSSGIGAELVRQLARGGAKVAAIARRRDRLESLKSELGSNVLIYEHDVTHYDEVPALFQQVTKELGGLDLIIYAAGVMPQVGPEEFDFEKDRQMIEVNVLGMIAWLNQAAVRFSNTRSGSIVGIGSLAGERGRCAQPVYNTSKAAVATYMEALRNRLARFGVAIVTIKPGPTATEMTAHMHSRMMDPAAVAMKVLEKADQTGEHYVKFVHKVMFAVVRNVPSFIFRRTNI
ncbi:MAG TPA: SDR family NAD(P)-dependent oxidoreductase [Fimbriimonas sp.]|nr:SDR family NAD(P)-dependent oxidoreductase [Fimbriimonas sp.]